MLDPRQTRRLRAAAIVRPTEAGAASFEPKGPAGSRRRVVVGPGHAACYHVMSRTAGGQLLFGPEEKEALRMLSARLARFCGVRILTYALMDNHFHLLIRVPCRAAWMARFQGPEGEGQLLEHLRLLYSDEYLSSLRSTLANHRACRREDLAAALLDRYRERLCDLEHFVKELKERFSRWFNRRHDRRGTLWMERFRSVLVEDGEALRTIAAYIDLNPVRAGLCNDPREYRWCGYAEACRQPGEARDGIRDLVGIEDETRPWSETGPEGPLPAARSSYLGWLSGMNREPSPPDGAETGPRDPKTKAERDALKSSDFLRRSVRYFSDGLAVGSQEFVDHAFDEFRDRFGPARKSGARRIPELEQPALYCARQLKVRAVSPPGPPASPAEFEPPP